MKRILRSGLLMGTFVLAACSGGSNTGGASSAESTTPSYTQAVIACDKERAAYKKLIDDIVGKNDNGVIAAYDTYIQDMTGINKFGFGEQANSDPDQKLNTLKFSTRDLIRQARDVRDAFATHSEFEVLDAAFPKSGLKVITAWDNSCTAVGAVRSKADTVWAKTNPKSTPWLAY